MKRTGHYLIIFLFTLIVSLVFPYISFPLFAVLLIYSILKGVVKGFRRHHPH